MNVIVAVVGSKKEWKHNTIKNVQVRNIIKMIMKCLLKQYHISTRLLKEKLNAIDVDYMFKRFWCNNIIPLIAKLSMVLNTKCNKFKIYQDQRENLYGLKVNKSNLRTNKILNNLNNKKYRIKSNANEWAVKKWLMKN